MDFGDYVLIEQKRYGIANERYLHKVIGRLRSNTFVPVPVQAPATEVSHGGIYDVVSCIRCGVNEQHALRYKATDVKKITKGGSMKIDTTGQGIIINGVSYVPLKDWKGFDKGEVVEIKEVRAEYRLGSTWLCLSFEMPGMRFKPGDRIRIVKEG